MKGSAVPSRKRVAPAVLVAYAGFVFVGVSAGVGGVLLPAQIHDYGVDKTTIGLTFFTFSAGFLIAGLSAGAIARRFDSRTATVVGCLAYVASALYVATRPSFAAFIIVQIVGGFGTGLLESFLNTYLSTLPNATTLLNRLHGFFGVGALAGPLLAAKMLTFTRWTSVWLVLGLACGVLAVAVRVTFPAREAVTAAVRERHASARPKLSTVMRDRGVILGGLLLSVYVGLEVSLGNWGYTFLVDTRHLDALLAGYAMSGYWLGLAVGRFVISPVAERVRLAPTGMIFVCLSGVAVASLLTWWAPAAVVAGLGFAVIGFFLGPIFPTTMAVVPKLTTPFLIPTAIGLINGVSVIGGALFPWIAGAVGQSVGIWTVLPFAAALAVAQLVVWRSLCLALDGRPIDHVGLQVADLT